MRGLNPGVRAVFWANLGATVRERRLLCELTQDFVARVVGIPRSAMVLIEDGRREVTLVEALAIAAVLRMNLDELMAP